ncbi:MAG: DNA repair protein RecN [Bacteroidales bacterium]|nr:DNA repair protein RecN [Bacteroidales bacterium]
MLKTLSVENYALIDKAFVKWNEGFSVITGETGSGKSILLGALGLIQGNRADVKVLKDSERKCVVEAEFDISSYSMSSFFEENELDEDDLCIVRREITPNGKSRAFINDTPVALTVLKSLSSYLIDIHSQHETLLLNQDSFQMHVLDSLADTKVLLNSYGDMYHEYILAKKQLQELKQHIETQNSNRDYIEFQLKQLSDANFKLEEQSELESEMEQLSHSSELKEALSKTSWLLSDREEDVCSSLKDSINALSSIASVFPKVQSVNERLNSSWIELKDIAREVDQLLSDVTVDPQRLEYVNERLDLIYTLEKKHRVNTMQELLEVKASFEKDLALIESSSDQVESLQKKIDDLGTALTEKAHKISEMRRKAKEPMERSVEGLLQDLGIANAKFEVSIESLDTINSTGLDSVRFLFSANKNAPLQPLSSVASGGEMARVMLALKSILSKTEYLPTLILDEIDTGVSGDVASRMGNLMTMMGEYMQVVSITHLPQIASKGTTHYKVYKEDDEESTVSHIKQLTLEERVMEIAQMLSGTNPSPAAIANAKDLMNIQ